MRKLRPIEVKHLVKAIIPYAQQEFKFRLSCAKVKAVFQGQALLPSASQGHSGKEFVGQWRSHRLDP